MKRRVFAILSMALALSRLFGCAYASADAGTSEAAELVMDIPTTQYFTEEAVPDADVEKILQAGVNAPSAMNTQPWHFTAVTDAAVLEDIASSMSFGAPKDSSEAPKDAPEGMKPPEGAEFPSGKDGTPPEGFKPTEDFPGGKDGEAGSLPAMAMGNKAGLTDAPLAIIVSCEKGSELSAGLAIQNMSVEAQLLGYGSKIISSPTMALNGERREEFAELLSIPEGQSAVAVLLVGREDTGVDTEADAYTGATTRSPMSEKVSYVKAK